MNPKSLNLENSFKHYFIYLRMCVCMYVFTYLFANRIRHERTKYTNIQKIGVSMVFIYLFI